MQFLTIFAAIAAIASSVTARPADLSPVDFASTLFYQQLKTPYTVPPSSVCKPANTLDKAIGTDYYMCEIPSQRFIVSPQEMRDIWSKVTKLSLASKTVNSRRGDYSVEQFDGISDTANYYTIEHGDACQGKGKSFEKCIMVLFHRKF